MIAYFSHSEPGGHEENQDRFEVRLFPATANSYLCAVADGQGGRAGAALAAATAARCCLDKAETLQPEQLLRAATWPAILRVSDDTVAETKDAGFTALVAFYLTENYLCGCSSGDSAILVVNARQQTSVLTEHQVKNPPIGSRAAVLVPFATRLVHPWTGFASKPPKTATWRRWAPTYFHQTATFLGFVAKPPWTVLAMTDGVWKYSGWDKVSASASEEIGQAIIVRLRQHAALRCTGTLQDDFTLVVFQG